MSITLRDTVLTYPDGDGVLHALDHVNFAVGRGELVAVTGPSGSGKSSLLAVAGLLTAPDSGIVMVDDVDEHHRHAVEQGAEVVYPPVDQPYGFREYSARDPEGGLWSFMKPLG